MSKDINYFASALCPAGCGEVIYLQALDTKIIFCHCTGCGCNWNHPKHAQFESGLNQISPIHEYAENGIELPSEKEIVAAGFSKYIFGFSEDAGTYSAWEINKYAYENS